MRSVRLICVPRSTLFRWQLDAAMIQSKPVIMLCVLGMLCACYTWSNGVYPIGPDTYMVSHTGGSGFESQGRLRSGALKEAGEYCSEMGRAVKVDLIEGEPTGPRGYPHASVTVTFLCLPPSDPELDRPKLRPLTPHR